LIDEVETIPPWPEAVMITGKRNTLNREAATELAQAALIHVVSDPDRLSRFMGVTGFDASDARNAARTPGFLAGVLSYLLTDEETLVGFCEAENVAPISVPLAYRTIEGGDPTLEINEQAWRPRR
jgi:Protein of unknown function (DUF3572)